MNRNLLSAAAFVLLVGCNSLEIGLLPLFVPFPEFDAMTGVCKYGASNAPAAFLTVDVEEVNGFSIQVVTRNTLNATEVLISQEPENKLVTQNIVTPLRFDYRWECDSQGFSGDEGAIRLPAFSVDKPFCLDTRDETTRDFVGFDVVSATGAAIEPGADGVIETRPITPQLGQAFRDLFRLAIAAELCCQSVNGCENLPTDADLQNGDCATLQSLFNQVAGVGTFDVRNVEDVQIWRPFVTHTRSNGTNVAKISPYKIRMRGIFEGVTETGDLVTSAEFAQDFGICLGCGGGIYSACYGD